VAAVGIEPGTFSIQGY